LIPFAALVALAVVGLTVLNAYLGAHRVTLETENQLRQVARTLLDARFPLSDRVLQQMHGLTGAHFVITEDDGSVRAASIAAARLQLSSASPQDHWQDLTLTAAPLTGDEQLFAMALKLNRPDPPAGPTVLHILYPVRSFRDARWAAVYPSLAFGIAVLAVAIALSAWIAQRLSQPIRKVCTHVGRLAEGDFTQLDAPAQPDELLELVASINRLSAELLNMRDAIGRRERLALLGQLSAGMVHHLRNDVTGTRMALQLHDRSCKSGDQEGLEVALRQLTLTEEHLKGFLAVGQPLHVQKRSCDLGELLQEIARLIGPTLMHRRIRFALNLPEDRCLLPLDVPQFRQAVIALLLNAMDAVGQGGAIELVLEQNSAGNASLCVCDSGPGPSREVAERMFEPFFTSKPEGVGLGLTAARNIAVAHGGSLAYSRHENRTVFRLTLPAHAPREREQEGALIA
jgi:signal transduction histidine kinase